MGLTYKDAGVDKTKGYEEVKLLSSQQDLLRKFRYLYQVLPST